MKATAVPLIDDPSQVLLPFVRDAVLGAAEVHGADTLVRQSDGNPMIRLGAAFALWAPLHGHVCFDLAAAATLVRAARAITEDAADDAERELPWPILDTWVEALQQSTLVRVVDRHDALPVLDDVPLVLCGTRLYTQRQWIDEGVVARCLRERAAASPVALTAPALRLLDELLPPIESGHQSPQHDAALAAAQRRLSVITGGPGTGKTHTLARVLAVAFADARARGKELRVAMAAPTGKAAQRMGEAVSAAVASRFGRTDVPGDVLTQLAAVPSSTLHRLLGPLPVVRTRFKSDAEHPLPYDVVAVDETSMVPLPMMARLLEALSPQTQLILLGDPDQLASVDAGAILGDVVAAARRGSLVAESWSRLGRSHRQAEGSPIGPLSDAIRDGLVDEVLDLLRSGAPDVVFVEQDDAASAPRVDEAREILDPNLRACRQAALSGDSSTALEVASSFRILCAHRRGPFGAESWNEMAIAWATEGTRAGRDFAGRMLLVTRNDLRNRLNNGDSGVVVAEGEQLRAAFRIRDDIRMFAPAQLEDVETAFATTVHKSQGSEYDTVVVVLPGPGSPLARRELLYTAVTRATRRLVVVGSVGSLVASVATRTPRASGLVDALTRG